MRIIQNSIAAAALCVGATAPLLAWAQSNSIKSITSAQQGSATVLRIQMAKPPTDAPPSFTIANPPRVAMDFKDTDSKLGKNLIEMLNGDVHSVNVVQGTGRSRVVLNLKRPLQFQSAIQGSTIVVSLDQVAAVASAPVSAAPAAFNFAKGDPSLSHALRDINFRRGKDGEGRIVVELSDAQTGVDIKQQGQTIVVDFQRARLPDNLRRRLDVADFGTPVRQIRAFQQGDNARMVIEPQGLREHNAYQSDTQFVVEVKQIKEDPNKTREPARSTAASGCR